MRIMGIDLGEKRVGIALSDPLKITAQGVCVLERKDKSFLEKINDIVKQENVSEIVLGLPLNMDGSKGKKVDEAEAFALVLKEKTGVNIKLWDERLTTFAAERIMIEANTSRKKRKEKIDKIAAQLILQGYLDSLG
ncbi:MAG: Holliday junction resolvase RuvX [Candidatus Omnitrophica bacterium]|nr:Holliday junction resolvase RuvX [Candidatus Omnitrophota bacterium]